MSSVHVDKNGLFEITPKLNIVLINAERFFFMIDSTKTEKEDLDTSMLGFRLILC